MKIITSIEELKALAIKERFYIIDGEDCLSFIYAGDHPTQKELVIAINGSNLTKAVCFSRNSFTRKCCFISGTYNSREVGEIFISLLKEEIEIIKSVYFED